MRPLAAALCMGKGKFVLDGVPRMRERPIADLIDGLQQLGADVTCVKETGCPPVTINAKGLEGGKALISGKMSSLFLSSIRMLMASPFAGGFREIRKLYKKYKYDNHPPVLPDPIPDYDSHFTAKKMSQVCCHQSAFRIRQVCKIHDVYTCTLMNTHMRATGTFLRATTRRLLLTKTCFFPFF